jgi:hypothetical protein
VRVIFLDIDGVLNHRRSMSIHAISKPAARLLRQLVRDTDAKIVLSSSWRKIEEAVYAFRKKTLLTEISKTPSHWHGIRGYEIKEWLEENPYVDEYVIIDDESDMLEEQRSHFVKCDMQKGFTEEESNIAKMILLGSNSSPYSGKLFGESYMEEKTSGR